MSRPAQYLDDKGNMVFVSRGISKGDVWISVRRKPGALGTHRIVSKWLPEMPTRDQAQQRLDSYAYLKNWQKVAPETENGEIKI